MVETMYLVVGAPGSDGGLGAVYAFPVDDPGNPLPPPAVLSPQVQIRRCSLTPPHTRVSARIARLGLAGTSGPLLLQATGG
jgi:hypothetical protein